MNKAEVDIGEDEIVTDLAYFQGETLENYFEFIFDYADKLGLPVISIDKANVMARYVFWREVCKEVHATRWSHIELRHQLVDSANALLFTQCRRKKRLAGSHAWCSSTTAIAVSTSAAIMRRPVRPGSGRSGASPPPSG